MTHKNGEVCNNALVQMKLQNLPRLVSYLVILHAKLTGKHDCDTVICGVLNADQVGTRLDSRSVEFKKL